MKCIEVSENLDALLDGEMDFSTQEKISSHLETCFSCQTEFKDLQAISKTMKQTLPIAAPMVLDEKVLNAFQTHHAREQTVEGKEKIGWFGIPKLAFATALLLLALFSGLAFQLGKMSASNIQVSMSDNFENKQQSAKEISDRDQIEKKNSEKIIETRIVEVPVIKERIVEVPVYKEKIITRIVYVDKDKRKLGKNSPEISSPQDTFAINNAVNGKEFLTQTNLQNFQPVSEIKPRITKKEE